MKLRIAMVGACPYPAPQGSQVFMRNTAQCLQHAGHEVHLVVYGYGVGTDHSGLRIHRAARLPFATKTAPGPSIAKPFQDITLTYALHRVIEKHHIQVVCAHNYEALFAALLTRKRPLIYFAHNAMSDELPYFLHHPNITEEIGNFLDRRFPHRADAVIAPHRRLAGHLVVRGCEQDQVNVVPPPIEAQWFDPSPLDTSSTPPVIYTGNLDAYQNLPLLFDAMKLVRNKRPETRLIIATAEKAKGLDAEIAPIMGFDTLYRFLAQDAVFAAPRVSWSGYPIKMLNAMAAGKAVVACESAAYPITHEETGLIVPDNDVHAYAAALLQLIENPNLRARLGAKARETILEKHHPEAVARQLEEIALAAYDPYKTTA
ncbi:MAG: glycosyltransferase family 4 protein [Candidatus Hydrogenedentes bacterium]|nr:glycosyltransferase family 4 protein [Candidatus Hydrogenedentota bacterium]